MNQTNEIPLSISLEDVEQFDDREMYELADLYLKGRFAEYAMNPSDRELLEERELRPADRSEDYETLFKAVKTQVGDILYSEVIIQRYRTALQKTLSAVEKQLREFSDNAKQGWRSGANGFRNMVKDELKHVQAAYDEIYEQSPEGRLHALLDAVDEHRAAVEADKIEEEDADERLWAKAEAIALEGGFRR